MIRKLPEVDDNFRLVPVGCGLATIRRDFVPPVPVGSYIACVFRVTGYSPDCDGEAMAQLEQVGRDGRPTGWTAGHLVLYPDTDVVVDNPDDLHKLAEEAIHGES